MDLKLGDFVRFVDENIEGYITRIIDKEMIGVTDSNDFEIPVPASKVTLVYGEIPDGNTVVTNRPAAAAVAAEFVRDGVFLGLVSDQHSASVAHFHLVNDSSFDLLLSLTTSKGGHFKAEFAGTVNAHSSKRIYSANMSDIQVWPKFLLDVIYYTAADEEPKAPLVFHAAIKGKDLSVAKVEIAQLKTKGWLLTLEEKTEPMNIDKLRDSFN
ncbi:hypothetical protein [Pedobacter duraquae]|uniref:Uncharacterized protein n=1 Tax=Pedobacter duraquae TaxID=425511 RepID=A0A4R6IIH0_9SPHI|nr:hypothetical protein [Pedobacter duraquae]TDO21753.1 hypothetical protein CLV32_2861 [Pedobacter duraquae]